MASLRDQETSAGSRDDLAAKLARREVQRGPSSIPGREIVQVVTEIPAGIESGWHVHPGEEVGYIVAGEVEMMVQGRPNVILRAGDGFLIPPRTSHNARDLGPETGRMLSTYIVETGQPLATLRGAIRSEVGRARRAIGPESTGAFIDEDKQASGRRGTRHRGRAPIAGFWGTRPCRSRRRPRGYGFRSSTAFLSARLPINPRWRRLSARTRGFQFAAPDRGSPARKSRPRRFLDLHLHQLAAARCPMSAHGPRNTGTRDWW